MPTVVKVRADFTASLLSLSNTKPGFVAVTVAVSTRVVLSVIKAAPVLCSSILNVLVLCFVDQKLLSLLSRAFTSDFVPFTDTSSFKANPYTFVKVALESLLPVTPDVTLRISVSALRTESS